MIPLPKLKKDVQFNNELTKVVDVMKGIAAARFHILERQLALFEAYFDAAGAVMSMVDVRQVAHSFVQPRTPVVGVIMITSNEGFLGGLNGQVVSAGVREGGADGVYVMVGERGMNYIRDARRDCTMFPGVEDTQRQALAVTVRDYIVKQVLDGRCGRVVVAYPKPISFAVQKATVEALLPCGAWPMVQNAGPPPAEVIWESQPADVLEYVVQQSVGARLDQLFALSRLSELAARAVHLEGSYQELLRRGKKLKSEYFRARHEVIDRSMREIFAAQLLSRVAGAKTLGREDETNEANEAEELACPA